MSEKVEDELEGVGEETNEQDQDELFEHHRFV